MSDNKEKEQKPIESPVMPSKTEIKDKVLPAEAHAQPEITPAQPVPVNKPEEDGEQGLMKATRSWRHAAANAIAFSFAMLISFILQFTAVLLLVSEQWIRDNHWDVEQAWDRFLWLLSFSFFLCPLVFCINLLLRRDEEPVKTMMLRMELIGALSSLLLGALYYWPGYLR